MDKEKAKRYDEALEIAKKNYITAQDLCEGSKIGVECFKNTLEKIFPELKESEDEKIIKWIIDDIRYNMDNEPLNNSEYKKKAKKAIGWLEKQVNKELVNINELKEIEDDSIKKELTEFLKSASGGFLDTAIQCKTFGKWVAWLEKQSEQKKSYDICDSFMMDNKKSPYSEKRDFGYFEETSSDKANSVLHAWKPSDEQMKALAWALSLSKNCGEECAYDLETLQDQLKKLRNE